jgi:hypothetical protein
VNAPDGAFERPASRLRALPSPDAPLNRTGRKLLSKYHRLMGWLTYTSGALTTPLKDLTATFKVRTHTR